LKGIFVTDRMRFTLNDRGKIRLYNGSPAQKSSDLRFFLNPAVAANKSLVNTIFAAHDST